jgi:hypothetical protein
MLLLLNNFGYMHFFEIKIVLEMEQNHNQYQKTAILSVNIF